MSSGAGGIRHSFASLKAASLAILAYAFTAKGKRQDSPIEFQRGGIIKDAIAIWMSGIRAGSIVPYPSRYFRPFSSGNQNAETLGTRQNVECSIPARIRSNWRRSGVSTLKALYNRARRKHLRKTVTIRSELGLSS